MVERLHFYGFFPTAIATFIGTIDYVYNGPTDEKMDRRRRAYICIMYIYESVSPDGSDRVRPTVCLSVRP